MDNQIGALIKQNPACLELTKLEGVGPISAVLLFASLGTGEAFKNGREYSAYLGLTPKQYSSGGKTQLIGISKRIANKRLRAILIQVYALMCIVRRWAVAQKISGYWH